MYIDKNLVVSGTRTDVGVWSGQNIQDTEVSDYSVDLGAAKNLSKGKQLYMVILIDTAFTHVTSVNFQVVTDTGPTLPDPTVQIETGAIAIESLTLDRVPIVIPIGSALGTEERWLGMQYTVASASGSEVGTVIAFVAFDAP